MSPDPSLKGLLGRYEYKDATSDKFWTLTFNSSSGMYEARWGRNGSAGQGPTEYNGDQARKKIQEKLAKGYHMADDRTAERESLASEVRNARKGVVEANDFMKELKKL